MVDGGSGYLSQNQYPLLVGSRFGGTHNVSVTLPRPGATAPNNTITISFAILPGQKARVFAPSATNPNGRVVLTQLSGPSFDPALFVLSFN